MKLKDFGFSFKGTAPTPDEGRRNYWFTERSQAISSFLTTKARQAKIEVTAGFDGMFVFPDNAAPDPDAAVVRGRAYCVPVPVDWVEYARVLDDATAFGAFICDVFRRAFGRIDAGTGLPVDAMLSWMDAFEEAEYKHVFTYVRKVWRARGITAELICATVQNAFRLRLKATVDGRVIWDDVILEALPDPLHYYYAFKGLELRDDRLLVTSRQPADAPPLLEIPI
ncbi:MAG: hypothetical protein P1U83_14510 [Roseovarius sp.]|nr:hypothetical protein [Roseovarius sp.]